MGSEEDITIGKFHFIVACTNCVGTQRGLLITVYNTPADTDFRTFVDSLTDAKNITLSINFQ